ncbi:MAG: type II secretion system GspH family protein [Candidatus Omnitrophica bacterium]|nr:type II secretion system GspH family protein [Candidatus Omnitrophota bacterium]
MTKQIFKRFRGFLNQNSYSRLRDKARAGFLLIEVLITVVVLGTAIVFIVQALSSSLFAARRASLYTEALMLMDELNWDVKLETYSQPFLSRGDFPKSSKVSKGKTDFNLRQELFLTDFPNLSEMVLTVSWTKGEFSTSTYVLTAQVEE